LAVEPWRESVLREHGVDHAEVITLTLPHDQRFVNVARIVVGGLAARLDLPYESLDDLQLAVESVLSEQPYVASEEVTIEIAVGDRMVSVRMAPLDTEAIERDLGASEDGIGLGTLLGAVVDSVRFEDRDGGRWLLLEKRVPAAGRGPR
jgi:hypothetical protein